MGEASEVFPICWNTTYYVCDVVYWLMFTWWVQRASVSNSSGGNNDRCSALDHLTVSCNGCCFSSSYFFLLLFSFSPSSYFPFSSFICFLLSFFFSYTSPPLFLLLSHFSSSSLTLLLFFSHTPPSPHGMWSSRWKLEVIIIH